MPTYYGWNRDTDVNTGGDLGWGDNVWGAFSVAISVTGVSATSATDDVASVNTDQVISPTAAGLTSAIGTFSITADATITVVAASEPELDTFVGDAVAAAEWVVYPTGNALTSAVGTVGTSAFVTGVSATASEGDATQETSYMAPSEEATTSVGTLNIQTDVTFTITGVSATSSTGTLGGIFWSEVDDSNSSMSWTEVHKAA